LAVYDGDDLIYWFMFEFIVSKRKT